MSDKSPEDLARQAIENAKILAEMAGDGDVNTDYTRVPTGTYVGTLDPTVVKEGESIAQLLGPWGKNNDYYALALAWKLPDDVAQKYGATTVRQQFKVDLIQDPLTGRTRFANKNDFVNANVELGKLLKAVGVSFAGFKVSDLYYKSALLEVVHEEDNRDADKPVAERRVYAKVGKVSRLQSI